MTRLLTFLTRLLTFLCAPLFLLFPFSPVPSAGINKQVVIAKKPLIIWTAVFSPDGRYIVTQDSDLYFTLWDVKEEQPEDEPPFPHGFPEKFGVWTSELPGNIQKPAFGPDGKELYTLVGVGNIVIRKVPGGGRVKERIEEVIVVKNYVVALDVATGKEVRRFEVGPGNTFLFFPDGKNLLTQDQTSLTIRDLSSGEIARTVKLEGDPKDLKDQRIVAISGDGKRVLASASSHGVDSIKEWDLATGKLNKLKDGGNKLRLVMPGYLPNDASILCVVFNEKGFWDLRQGNVPPFSANVEVFGQGPLSDYNGLVFSDDGKHLAYLDRATGRVQLCNQTTGKLIMELPDTELIPEYSAITFSPDGKKLLILGASKGHGSTKENRVLVLWSLQDRQFERVFAYPRNGPRPAALLKKGKS